MSPPEVFQNQSEEWLDVLAVVVAVPCDLVVGLGAMGSFVLFFITMQFGSGVFFEEISVKRAPLACLHECDRGIFF